MFLSERIFSSFVAFICLVAAAVGPAQAQSGSGQPHSSKPASRKPAVNIASEPMAPPTGKKIDVWELNQESKMVGPIRCLISPQAVRLRAQKMGITWMFKAPSWDAYLFNTETKNYCRFPYSEWKEKAFFTPGKHAAKAKQDLQQIKVSKTGKTMSIAGSKAAEVALIRSDGTRYGELWMASDIVAPKQFSELVASMVMVPIKTSGTPLRATMVKPQSKTPTQVFDTLSVSKKSVDSAVFEPMKGFHRVKDEMALLFAESPDGGAGGLLDDDVRGSSLK